MIPSKQGYEFQIHVLAAWLVIGAGSPACLAETATGSIDLDIPRPEVTGPAWTSVVASAIVPGSGQWLEGRRETALSHGTAALVSVLLGLYGADQATRMTEAASSGAHLRMAAAVALAGLAVWSPLELWWASRGSPGWIQARSPMKNPPPPGGQRGASPENGEVSVH